MVSKLDSQTFPSEFDSHSALSHTLAKSLVNYIPGERFQMFNKYQASIRWNIPVTHCPHAEPLL